MNIKKITNFIFEIGQLSKKRIAGMQLIGVTESSSVADHVLRASQIGYILAELEGDVNPEKVASMVLFHDNGKTRIGDQDKVAARYSFKKEAEELSFADQIDGIGRKIEKKLHKYNIEMDDDASREGAIAKDAGWLEQAFQAKEHYDLGHKKAETWVRNVEKALKTKSAKLILKNMKKTNFAEWWEGLMVMTYK